MSDQTFYLSEERLEALKKELVFLKDSKIPDIATRIDEAKQLGDLSENAEYHAAKDDMAWARGRLLELQHIIDHAQITDSAEKGVVSLGSTISVQTKGNNKSFTLVGAQEADPLSGKISNESPLGLAFMGHKVGDKVKVITPAGETDYEILEIK